MASPRGGVAAASTRPFTLIESGSNHHTTTSPVGPKLWPVSNILMDKIRLQTLGFWDMSQVYGFGGVSIHGSVTMICGANASVHQDAGCHNKTHSGPYDKDPSYTWPYDPWPTTHLLLVASPTAKASPKSSRSKQCICHWVASNVYVTHTSSQVSLTMQLGSTDSSKMLPIQYIYIYVYSINMYCTYTNMYIYILYVYT